MTTPQVQVTYSDCKDKFLYLVTVGDPVLEVAVVAFKGRQVLEYLHLFINHHRFFVDESLFEHPPITDFRGTQREHGISELELEYYGVPLTVAKSRLEHFINENYIKYPLVVDSYSLYDSLGISRLPNTWRPHLRGPHKGKCPAHLSSYYKGKHLPMCALTLAVTTFRYGDNPFNLDDETISTPSLSPLSQYEKSDEEDA